MKKTYRTPEAKLVILNTDDIITLSSVLEPDYLNEDENDLGIPNESIGKLGE